MPELAKHFSVVAFERPGHGHTADTGEPFSYQAMAELTIDFVRTLGLESANVVGWSDGAIVSLLAAITRPDMVNRVVSIGGNITPSGLSPGGNRLAQEGHSRILQEG